MKIQDIVSDVRSRVESVGKPYQDAFKACAFAQRKAFDVVTRNGQTLANTEIGAAKNVFAAARASFDKARTDGVRQVVNNPQAYVPNGRNQIVAAYRDSRDLLVRTGNELSGVLSTGYRSVRRNLSTRPNDTQTTAGKRADSASSGTRSRKSAATSGTSKTTTTAKRKTAATRKSAPRSGGTAGSRAQSSSASAASSSDTTSSDSTS